MWPTGKIPLTENVEYISDSTIAKKNKKKNVEIRS